jgi:hypothetical protein
MMQLSTTVRASRDQLSAEMSEEAVILELETGTYYSVNEVGAFVWGRLQEPRTVSEICRDVCEEFEVDESRCETDVLAFLGRLQREGLIEIAES